MENNSEFFSFPICSVILIKWKALINHLPLKDKERFIKLSVRQTKQEKD